MHQELVLAQGADDVVRVVTACDWRLCGRVGQVAQDDGLVSITIDTAPDDFDIVTAGEGCSYRIMREGATVEGGAACGQAGFGMGAAAEVKHHAHPEAALFVQLGVGAIRLYPGTKEGGEGIEVFELGTVGEGEGHQVGMQVVGQVADVVFVFGDGLLIEAVFHAHDQVVHTVVCIAWVHEAEHGACVETGDGAIDLDMAGFERVSLFDTAVADFGFELEGFMG